jgi:hypothetical protein
MTTAKSGREAASRCGLLLDGNTMLAQWNAGEVVATTSVNSPGPLELVEILRSTLNIIAIIHNAGLAEGPEGYGRVSDLEHYDLPHHLNDWIRSLNPDRLPLEEFAKSARRCITNVEGTVVEPICLNRLRGSLIAVLQHWGLEDTMCAEKVSIVWGKDGHQSAGQPEQSTGARTYFVPADWPPQLPEATGNELFEAVHTLYEIVEPIAKQLRKRRDDEDLAETIVKKLAGHGSSVAPAFVPNELQQKILDLLYKKPKKLAQLAVAVGKTESATSGKIIGPLKIAGKVIHKRGLGYYRPDALPPEFTAT